MKVTHHCYLCAIVQHGLTVQYGLANTTSSEQKVQLCQQLVEMADILLHGYRTQLESIMWHLKHQSKAYTTAARYDETLRKYEQDRTLLLAPLSTFSYWSFVCIHFSCYLEYCKISYTVLVLKFVVHIIYIGVIF